MKKISVHWFRNDLRQADNPALVAAARQGDVLPVFIFDTTEPAETQPGGASRVWLREALRDLDSQLGGNLRRLRGDPERLIPELVEHHQVRFVSWTRQYDAHSISRDSRIKSALKASGREVQSFNGTLLWEPWDVQKGDGSPYKVFTPFYTRGCMSAPPPRNPLAAPEITYTPLTPSEHDFDLDALLPHPRWDKAVLADWTPTGAAALDALELFLESQVGHYAKHRDLPSVNGTSRLAPYLHFGQLSPNQIWYACAQNPSDTGPFKRQLAWREFSTHLLFHNPTLPNENLNRSFNQFDWQSDPDLLSRWQRGQTGVPFVDAAMRELWQTGYMHNRLRMVVASFLVKNLRVHWREGAAWFWDTLFDADLANNSASWQWVAGSGADAAPYFRIFNPVSQAQKFDPKGQYMRRFLPELAHLPDKYLSAPWTAPAAVLKDAGIELGTTYPLPMVDLKESRAAALEAYAKMRAAT